VNPSAENRPLSPTGAPILAFANSAGSGRVTARRVVALVGNPNTGKTSLFNALTGFRRHVANYPGVTVEVACGPIRGSRIPLELLDLPGTYSLAATAPDELVLSRALCAPARPDRCPSLILAVVDASNLARNLYLLSQLLELNRPVVVALNMVDIARARGIEIDVPRLAEHLGIPVIPVVATHDDTIAPLVRAIEATLDTPPPTNHAPLPPEMLAATTQLQKVAPRDVPRGEALRTLVDVGGVAEQHYLGTGGDASILAAARASLAQAGIEPGPAEVRARYRWIDRLLAGVIDRRVMPGKNWSARIDQVLTHRVAGAFALALILYSLFYAIYAGAAPVMDAVSGIFDRLSQLGAATLPAGVWRSLVTDGLIAGIGGVLGFLPQILVLFLFIAVLEDCGYLARAAFMVDRLMRPLGLSGRAFIPLLSSFACTVPAILGARSISDHRERLITILIAPFMSCSARLPIYILLISAFVPRRAWLGGWVRLDALVMLGVYVLGALFAIAVALLLRSTLPAGSSCSFLLELPSYKLPRLRTLWQRMYLAGRSFVVRAGTIILAVNLVVWALGYFPHSSATQAAVAATSAAEHWPPERYEAELAGAHLRDSYLGRIGHALEPAIRPLGWDWRIGVGVVASFPAREVILATLGTVFNLGSGADAGSSLPEAVRHMTWEDGTTPLFTLPVALSLMVFFALCAQCASTLVTIGREAGNWWWSVASFVGMTSLAYGAAWTVTAICRGLGI